MRAGNLALARGLLVLAVITSTRYFNYAPDAQREPILSAQGDRLRAECFSACNGVYARLDLLQSGFDGEIASSKSKSVAVAKAKKLQKEFLLL